MDILKTFLFAASLCAVK